MTISIKLFRSADNQDYRDFISDCNMGLLYHTPEYLGILTDILPRSQCFIIAAYDDVRMVGALVVFLHSTEHGTVLNSLPYFGSHGDVLLANDVSDGQPIFAALANAVNDIRREYSVGAMNIVSHLLTPQISDFASQLGLSSWDSRIGQISHLPVASNQDDALECVLANCLQKTRNLVRKGIRQSFEIEVSTADDDWQQMMLHHRLGMERIGGTPKSEREFLAIRKNLEPLKMCRLYIARQDGEFAGALLNLYYRDWVEYFTPVTEISFRNKQVMSALIAAAMSDAIVEGRAYWNWGGTWSTQAGVHRFKKGWGAVDQVYNYYGAVWDEKLAHAEPRKLLEQFPLFYVRPFGK